MTREQWLSASVDHLRQDFAAIGLALPPAVHISIGFPSTGALARRRRRLGECWNAAASSDGAPHIFLSPLLADPVEILAVELHELLHAALPPAAGHGPQFRRPALALGFAGRMRSTIAGPALALRLARLAELLRPLPHASLSVADLNRRKQGTRLLKVCCPCGYTVRVTAKWIGRGLPTCPCGRTMRLNAA